MGLKFEGSSGDPFLYTRTVHALFQKAGTFLLIHMKRIISVSFERRYGHRLKQIMEILSRGHGEPDDFMRRMICVICWYEGGGKIESRFGFVESRYPVRQIKDFPG